MDAFFFRLSNWAVLIVVIALAGGGLSSLTARYVFKRRLSLMGCMGALLAGYLFSFLFQFFSVFVLAAAQIYLENWAIGLSAMAAGMLGSALTLSRLRDKDTKARLGLLRALGVVGLAVMLPILLVAVALTASHG